MPDFAKRFHNPKIVGEFRSFVTKSNTFALALGVIIGAATQKVVSAIVGDVLMPLVGLLLPPGDWREAKIVLKEGPPTVQNGPPTMTALKYGDLIGTVVDFVVIALIVFLITKALIKGGTTKECPECKEQVPLGATRCRACTREFPPPVSAPPQGA
jgi:large conductance mechanosensitive channel